MRARWGEQERAHFLLMQWASSVQVDADGVGYPPAPIQPTVQGAKPPVTSPEEYADRLRRAGVLHSAWNRLRDESRTLSACLWRCYVDGKMESQPWLREAREAFLRHYDGMRVDA